MGYVAWPHDELDLESVALSYDKVDSMASPSVSSCKTKVVNSIAFSHDGSQIVSNLHRPVTWSTRGDPELEPHEIFDYDQEWGVCSVAFSPDDSRVVGGTTHSVMVWNTTTGELEYWAKPIQSDVNACICSHDGTRIASGSGNLVQIWDMSQMESPQDLQRLHRPQGSLVFVGLSCDNRSIAFAARDSIQFWNKPNFVENRKDFSSEHYIFCCALSRDGRRVGYGLYRAETTSVWVWNIETGTEDQLDQLDLRTPLDSLAFSYDGCHIVAGFRGGTVRIWNCQARRQISLYQLPAKDDKDFQYMDSVAFSRDGSRVAFYSSKIVWVWNPATGQIEHSRSFPTKWSASVAFSYSDNHVILCEPPDGYIARTSGGGGGVL